MNNWQFNTISIFYFLAICLSITIGFISRKKSYEQTGKVFSMLAFSTSLWTLGYFFGMFSLNIPFRWLMLRIEYLGSLASGYFWFLFVLYYTRREKWINVKTIILLAIIPLFSYIQILTIQHHHFFYTSTSFTEINNFLVFKKTYGPGFYIASSYNYFLTLTGIFLLLIDLKKIENFFQKQNIIVVLGVLIMLVPNFLYISGKNPFYPYDPTPIAFALAYLVFLFAIFKFQFLNIIPIAQNLVYKNLKNGVIIIDTKERVIGINNAAEQILEKPLKQALGKSATDLFPKAKDILKECLLQEESNAEIVIGTDSFFELHINTLFNNSEIPIGKIILLYNITKQKKAYQSLDAFASTVAHDLKSPISTIVNLTSLLGNEILKDDERKLMIEHINISAEKMSKIIDALLLLAKINNTEDFVLELIDNSSLVDEAICRLDSLIKKTGAIVIKPDFWIESSGQAELVEEIWVNYISNAIKYGGEAPVVKLSSQLQGNMVKLSVEDNGNGLSEEDQKVLFTEFTRLAKHRDQIIGHGLGLSIVKSIVTKLGGQVGIESKPGYGSTFYFTLPKACK